MADRVRAAQHQVHHKEDKEAVVAVTYAVVDPRAMVVHPQHTPAGTPMLEKDHIEEC